MRSSLPLIGLLILLGAGWGITLPLGKIAVSAGYQQFGLIFWQFVIGAALLGGLLALRGRLIWPNARQWRFAALISLIGTLLPNSTSYIAIEHLPSGVVSILMSLIPMIAFPIALALGNDLFSRKKLLGLVLGFISVILITLNSESFSGQVLIWWILVALIAPAFYAVEGNIVAKWGTYGLDGMQTLFWASVLGIFPAFLLAYFSDQFIAIPKIWAWPEIAFVLSSIAHAIVYSSYVWLVGRAGPVFAGQVSYLVTLFGVFWAIALLSESYTAGIWSALAIMICGLFLVQPKRSDTAQEAST